MKKERQEIIEYGKKLVMANLTKGTGGNLSIYDRKNKHMAITPSGLDFFEIKPEDIVIINEKNEIIEGDRTPSSEWYMHKIQYDTREDIDAVIHAHTIYATVLACLRWDLPATHYVIATAGKSVPCAEYATYGTKELAENAAKAMKGNKAVLLANHGILAGANNLPNAFGVIESVEYCAEIYYRAKSIGEPVLLSEQEMNVMMKKFETYGQRKKI